MVFVRIGTMIDLSVYHDQQVPLRNKKTKKTGINKVLYLTIS